MAYTGSPSTSAIDRIRLSVGDCDPDYTFLDDESYQYYLDKNNQNENRTTLDCIKAILFSLARRTRERAGDIELYGSEAFNNYAAALKLILLNPDLMNYSAMPYAGGISRQDMYDNDIDTDTPNKPFFIGFSENLPKYLNKTIYTANDNLQLL